MKQVVAKAMCMMVKSMSTWWSLATKNKDKNFQTYVRRTWPSIQEEDWKLFIASHTEAKFDKLSAWGKELRAKNMANHKLGSRGYIGKRRVWREKDDAAAQARKAPDFSYLYLGRGKDFMRARVDVDRFTRQTIFRN
jgi:hypothetical protein